MTRDVKIMTDGFTTLERGMDSGRDPILIGKNQMAFGVNTTVRGGFVGNRPGFSKLALEFGTTVQTQFTQGRWQGAKYFKPSSGRDERIICSISGRQFVFTPDQVRGKRNKVQEITPTLSDNTTTSSPFTVPAVGSSVTLRFADTSWFVIGQTILIGSASYTVVSVTTASLATVTNVSDTAGNTVASGTQVSCEAFSDRNNAYRWQVWMEQAEDFMVIQDGQGKAIIYNGSVARRAEADEVPTGTAMGYGLGRLWVARGREFVAGDIAGGPSGTALYNKRDAVLKFTENDYLNEGGAWLAPGDVTEIAFPTTLDTSVGQRDMILFHKGGAVAVTLPTDRDTWKNLKEPAQRVVLEPFGAMGRSVKVNNDLWFRARDGIRSYIVAQRQFGEVGNVPMSREMSAVLNSDDESLLGNATGVLFDNRLLIPCVGQRDFDRGYYYLGLVVLDFDLVSSMSDRLPPAYDGVWTGLKFLQVVQGEFNGVMRCFAFVLNSDREIEVWELTKSDICDRPSAGTESPIEWKVTLRRLGFEDNGDGLKRLAAARFWTDQMRGDIRITTEYRPDQYPIWQSWGPSWTKQAKKQWCAGDDCIPRIPMAQYRTRQRLPQLLSPDDEISDGKPMNQGHTFDIRVTCQGAFRLRRVRVRAEVVEEVQDWAAPEDDATDITVTGCPDSFLGYDASTPASVLLTTESGVILTTEGGKSLII